MTTSDVQVYSYVTDDGRRISVSLGAFGDLSKERRVDVSVTVDDVERLHASGHWVCLPTVPLGEWFVHAVMSCLCTHMSEWNMFHMIQNLLTMANADDVQMVPIDDRHISELTDGQAEWWNDDANDSVVDHLIKVSLPLAEKMVEEYPQLRINKENH